MWSGVGPCYHSRAMRPVAAIACLWIALAGLPAGAVEFDTTGWYQGADGFEQAVNLAKESGKPLFVYFRTDWCPYCKQFERELLSSDEVRRFFEDIVVVTINPEIGADENRIAAAYSVRGFPAIFMHPVEGRPRQLRRTVMRDGGVGLQTPEEFVATLSRAAGSGSSGQ
jgi:thiol-disulfide isomerase/thioredoxin